MTNSTKEGKDGVLNIYLLKGPRTHIEGPFHHLGGVVQCLE